MAVLAAGSLALPAFSPASDPTVKGVTAANREVPPQVMSAAADLAARPAPPVSIALSGAVSGSVSSRTLAAASSRPQREVFGFVNAGNLGNPYVGYPSWNFSLLTTVAYFGLHVNSGDGNIITYDTGWAVFHSYTMSSFVSAAHANGVRVIVSLNLHDFSTSPTNQTCTGLASGSAQNTINQAVAQVAAAGIDGVNVNYEGTNRTRPDGLRSGAEMTAFVKNLRAAMPNGYIAIDTYTGSAEDNLEFFDITGLAPYVHSFFVMAYDMDNDNWRYAPLNCPP